MVLCRIPHQRALVRREVELLGCRPEAAVPAVVEVAVGQTKSPQSIERTGLPGSIPLLVVVGNSSVQLGWLLLVVDMNLGNIVAVVEQAKAGN